MSNSSGHSLASSERRIEEEEGEKKGREKEWIGISFFKITLNSVLRKSTW